MLGNYLLPETQVWLSKKKYHRFLETVIEQSHWDVFNNMPTSGILYEKEKTLNHCICVITIYFLTNKGDCHYGKPNTLGISFPYKIYYTRCHSLLVTGRSDWSIQSSKLSQCLRTSGSSGSQFNLCKYILGTGKFEIVS